MAEKHLAQLMSYAAYGSPPQPQRNDRMRYVGFGIGHYDEVASVSRLSQPIAFDTSGNFLAELAIPTYPLAPARTTVEYRRSFDLTELSVTGTVVLTEAGLYTDGDPGSNYALATRNVTLAAAASQAPNAYKKFEPLKKTQNFVLQMAWQIRL